MTKEDIVIVAPHRKVSRPVTEADRERVEEVGEAMRRWMLSRYSCVGLAHPQVESEDPMAFFVALEEPLRIICNPRIITASAIYKDSQEGCMSYPDKAHTWRKRHACITVEYEVFKGKRLVKKQKLVTGFLAKVYQHEMDHLNGKYCYDEEETLQDN